MAGIDPMHQFKIHEVVHFPSVNVPGLGAVNLSITNSVMAMMVAALIVCSFFALSARRQIVPGRLQAVGESLYGLIEGILVGPVIGHAGKPYIPFIMTIFMLVLVMNMMGVVFGVGHLVGQHEWTFTATAQLAVTATLALITFFSVIIIGFVKNGLGFYKLFVPSGMPWPMIIIMAPIELLSFMIRPLTLAMRLFGNMLGGHVVMNIFASFVVGLFLFAINTGGIALLAILGSAASFGMVVGLTILELVVAGLQAFVFAALATVYLNEVVNLGHGH
jgi:F-type H+-transporting ATPase subunit a